MKIQALAVAAASLAFAAPALPAHADSPTSRELQRDMRIAAGMHCRALSNGSTWAQAIAVSANSAFGNRWYPAAQRMDREEGRERYAPFLIKRINQHINNLCPTLERKAWSAHRRNRDAGGTRYTGGYTGGNTTIQEDPFEF